MIFTGSMFIESCNYIVISFPNVIFIATRASDFVDNVCFLVYWNAILSWIKHCCFLCFKTSYGMNAHFLLNIFCIFLKQFFLKLLSILPRYGNLIHITSYCHFLFEPFLMFLIALWWSYMWKKDNHPRTKSFILWIWNLNFLLDKQILPVVKGFNPWKYIILWNTAVKVRILTRISGFVV